MLGRSMSIPVTIMKTIFGSSKMIIITELSKDTNQFSLLY